MLSTKQISKDMIPDREQLTLVGGKTLMCNSADDKLDSRCGSQQNITAIEKENSYLRDVLKENFNKNNSVNNLEGAEDDSGENFNDNQNKMAQVATALLSHQLSTKQTGNVKTSSLEAKRARVENIVTSIKDHPLRQQGLDLRLLKMTPERSAEEKTKALSSGQILLKSRKRNAFDDSHSFESGSPSPEKVLDFQRTNQVNGNEAERLSTKRPKIDEQFYGNNSSESDNCARNDITASEAHARLSKSSIANGFDLDGTYKLLVDSLKRELLSDLDRIAANFAKRILDELRRTDGDFHSLERNTLFSKFLRKKDPSSPSRFQIEKESGNSSTERSRSNTSVASNKDFDQEFFQVAFSKEKKEAYESTSKSYQLQEFEDQIKFKNDILPTVGRDEKGEQLEAISLVTKKSPAPSPLESDSSEKSTFVNDYSQKVSKHFAEQFQKSFLNSLSPSINRKRLSKSSRTPSPPRQPPFNKPLQQSLLQDGNFYSPNANPYRLPFNNNSVLASSLQRESMGSGSLLRNPFTYNSSMYPSMVQPQNGFPFPAGHLPLPFLQTLQQQRSLAHALADFNKLNDGGESGMGRSNSTRTSTREPTRIQGFSSKQQDAKVESIRYVSPSGLALNQFSSSSAQDSLTPLHLKKAKIMFFYTRYPSANTLKAYFPDVKFTRATTSQLIKWFSNFREFFYIQIEKFARQALSDGVTNIEQLQVTRDSELFRVLNLHYNKCNDFRAPNEFLGVTLSSLEEFFSAIEQGKDEDPSWKKPIYKIICKLDQDIPSQFKSPNVLDRLSEIL